MYFIMFSYLMEGRHDNAYRVMSITLEADKEGMIMLTWLCEML